ncbi:hypothetical protein [Vibrio nigripulchritudo]|nr:hypothetical protein [Vibrio nigripulchritudo]
MQLKFKLAHFFHQPVENVSYVLDVIDVLDVLDVLPEHKQGLE